MEFFTMEIRASTYLRKPTELPMFPLVVSSLFYFYVAAVNCQDTTEIFYDCEKYCHMDCEYIPETDPYHKEQCKAVHSHHSDCSCHFGGVAFGVFITLGLFSIIILMVCVGRYCRKRRTVTNTRIVVVTQPVAVATEDIQNNNYQYQQTQQNVYSIPVETKSTNYFPKISSDQEEQTTVTINAGAVSSHILDFEPASPNAPSRRIYFESSLSKGNGRIGGIDTNEDQIFAPPTF